MTVPKDELEKLTPEEKEAVKRYLEHVAQTGNEEKKKAAEEVLRRFHFGAKAVNIGGIRLGLVFKADRPPRAEKYGDPQLIAEIKTMLERKLREMLGDEYEQWRDHVKTTEGGKTPNNNTSTTTKTLPTRPQYRQNTITKKLKNT